MQKLVIGCGYLGERVARAWLAQGHNVAALTRSPQHADRFRSAGIEPILGDVLDLDLLTSLPEAQTLLYAVGFDRSADVSQREVYVNGLSNVLQAIRQPIERFIYISSTSVYGQDDGTWVDETSPTEPTRDNARVCLDAEATLHAFFADGTEFFNSKGETAVDVLRLGGIYGRGRLLQRVETLKSAQPLPGNPDAYLNLVHVDDAVQAIMACEARGLPGRTYLVCDNRPARRRDYYSQLASLVDAPEPTYTEAGDEANSFLSQGLGKRCSNRTMREELGVEPIYPSFESGLVDALAGE